MTIQISFIRFLNGFFMGFVGCLWNKDIEETRYGFIFGIFNYNGIISCK